MADTRMLEAAIKASEYFKIFPCRAGEKIPAIKGWQTVEMTEAEIRKWWTKHPNDNIGMCPKANGIVVVDVDIYKPECTFDDGVVDHKADLKVHTARGGYHLYYETEQGQEWKGQLDGVDGVDIKWNGVVVLPPSTNSDGQPYEWADDSVDTGEDLVLSVAPDWLVEGAGRSRKRNSDRDKAAALMSMRRGTDNGRLVDLVNASSNTIDDREDWLAVGMGLHYEYAGTQFEQQAKAAFLDWSQRWDVPEPVDRSVFLAEAEKAWEHFTSAQDTLSVKGSAHTGGSVRHLLKGAAPELKQTQSEWEDGFLKIDGEELLKMQLPDIVYLVDDVIPAGDLISFAGPSGAGKTRYIALLMACLLTGRTDIMGLPRAKRPVSTLYIANEEKGEDVQRRIRAAMTANGLRGEVDSWVRGKDHGRTSFMTVVDGKIVPNTKEIDRIIDFIKAKDIEFCVFDPFNTLGGEEENSASSVAQIMTVFAQIAQETGAAVCFVHHTPKMRDEAPDALSGDGGAWRGSGAIFSGLDEGFTLFPFFPETCRFGKEAKDLRKKLVRAQREKRVDKYIIVEHAKQREGEEISGRAYKFVSEPVRDGGKGIGALVHVPLSEAEQTLSYAVSGFAELATSQKLVMYAEVFARVLGEGSHDVNLSDIDALMLKDKVSGWDGEPEIRSDRGRGKELLSVMENRRVKVGSMQVELKRVGRASKTQKSHCVEVRRVAE